MSDNLSVLAQKLRPFWLRDMSPGTYALISGGGGGMVVHAINGAYHTGTLDQSQAPWAALAGRVIGAGAGLTGGGDLTADRALNVGAGTLITVGTDDVGITPGANYQFVSTGSGTAAAWQNISGLAGNGLAASAGALSVGVANTGAAGLSVEADVVRLTSSSNPGAAAAVLASDASGYLTLVRLIASDRLRSPLLDTATGQHLTVQPAADLLLDPGSALVKAQPGVAFQASNFASQVTGWRITHQGEADFRYLFTDEMHAKSFTVDLEQALAGGQIVSKSVAMLASNFTAPGGGTNTITLRAASTGTAVGQSSVAANKPTGTVSGDFMLAKIANWTGRAITPPSGWTLLTTQTGGSYTQVLVYYRVPGTTPYTPLTEPANYTWSLSGTDDAHLEIQTWYNVDTANPIDVYGGQGGAATTSVTTTSVTTTTANTRLVFFAGFSDSNNTSASATPAGGWTEHTDAAVGSYAWGYSMSKAQASAGTTGTVTATLAAAHQYAAVVLALRPSGNPVTTLTVRDLPSAPGMAVFQAGDIVRLRQFSRSAGSLSIADCWGAVTGYTDNGDKTQTWTFTRSSSPNAGSMAAGTVIQPDAITLDYGTDGNGFYEVNAIDGANAINSPYVQFVRWTGHPATGQAVRTRLGQLRGIFGQDEFGLFAGTGTANTDRYVRVSDYAAGNGINNLPFSLRNAGVEVVRLGGWNDVWVGPSAADKRLNWDGTTLSITGAVNITGGSGYGNLSDKPTSLSAINGTESTKLAGIAAGATVGATWGTNLGSIPIRFADAPSGNGLYLTASYMGFYTGGAWKTYIDNGGNFRFSYDASNYLEFNASTNRLRGVGGGTDQWYASATDGRLYAAAGKVLIGAGGLALLADTIDPGGGGLTSISWAKTLPNTGVTGEIYSWDNGAFNELNMLARTVSTADAARARTGTTVNNVFSAGLRATSSYVGGVWSHTYDLYGTGTLGGDVTIQGTLGVTGAVSLNGMPFSASGNRWGVLPYVDGAGVMEVGKYIDFHPTDGDTSDNTHRLAEAGGGLISYPSGAYAGSISTPSNGSAYGYFEYIYNSNRAGYLLWGPSYFAIQSDNNLPIAIIPNGTGKVGINDATPDYMLDVNGEFRTTGAVRSDTAFSLAAVSTPATSATYSVVYVDSADGKLKYKTTGGVIRTISYT